MVSRNDVLSEIEFNLARKEIKIKTIETTLFDDSMTYRFSSQSAGNIKNVLAGYKKQDIHVLILDLSNNSDGLLFGFCRNVYEG
ncbi:hypothetical protein AGMMS49573_02370 [Endomicrobiia bacterium]|nr:hypothetical protein AGMMS49573_02370 [Endomicrobiia bacterium]